MSIYLNWMSDAGLVRRTLAGNRDAFGALVMRHHAMAHALAWGHTGSATDADDVVQEAFLKAFTKLDTLREAEKFAGWLAGIVRNLAADLRIRHARVDTVSLDAVASIPAPAPRIDDEEIYALLRDTVLMLEEPAREVLTLHYFARKTLREVAAIQGITREAAMKRLQRARETLGKSLLDKLDYTPISTRQTEARKRAIIALVASASVAWKAAAATGVSVGVAAAAVVVFALLGASGFAAYSYRDVIFSPSAPPGDNPSPTVAIDSPAQQSPVGEPSTHQVAAREEGEAAPGSMSGRVLNLQGTPVHNATVRIELVDWPANALPPAETTRFEAQTDANGAIAFEALPLGEYSVMAFSGNSIDVTHASLDRETPHTQEDLYLKPGVSIAGRVVNGRGTPVAGAVLAPSYYAPLGTINDATVASAVRAVTDTSGWFKFPLIWPGGWKFLTRAPGYGNSESAQIEAGAQDALITLAGAARAVGHVRRGSDRAPMPGVEILLVSKVSPALTASAKSGDDGAFVIESLAPGSYDVQLSAQYAAIEEGPKKINAAEAEEVPLELVLGGGATLSGRVFYKDSGEGVPDVDVSIWGRGVNRNIKTDATGGYFFSTLPDGEYSISLSEREGLLRASPSGASMVVSGVREYELDIPAVHAVPLSGVVLDEAGAPTGRAMVNGNATSPAYPYPEGVFAEVKEDGHFTLHLRPDSHNIQLLASTKGAKSETLQLDSVPSEGITNLVLQLKIKGSSTVKAKVDTHGLEELMTAQMLEAHLALEGEIVGVPSTALRLPPTGEATFENVFAGKYRIALQNRQDYMTLCESAPFDVPEGKTVSGIVVSCNSEGDLSITGHVVDEAEQTIANAEVWISIGSMRKEIRVRCNVDGYFAFEKLKDQQEVYVNASAPGYGAAGTSAIAGQDDVKIVLQSVREVIGRVRDSASGKPIPDFSVMLRTSEGLTPANVLWSGGKKFHAADGIFTVQAPPQDEVYFAVVARGYVPGFQAGPPADGSTMEFALRAGKALAGRVTAPDGTPLSGVSISVAPPNVYFEDSRERMTSTDVNGVYQFAPGLLWPGIMLNFSHSDYGVTQRPVSEVETLDVVMEAGGEVVGQVVPWPQDGKYVLNAQVELLSGQAMSLNETTLGADGKFSFSRLATGKLSLILMKQTPMPNGYRTEPVAHAEVEVHNGERNEVLLEIPPPSPGPSPDTLHRME